MSDTMTDPTDIDAEAAPEAAGTDAPEAPAPETEPAAGPDTPDAAEEAALWKDRYVRLMAEFENFQKRTRREQAEWTVRAQEELAGRLLSVLDHMEKGLESAVAHDAGAAVVDGFRLVYDELIGVLGRSGLVPIDAEGEPFDPECHEAVSFLPHGEVPAHHVAVQIRRGYRFADRLLRPAQVVVSSGPPEDAGATEDGEGAEDAGDGAEA